VAKSLNVAPDLKLPVDVATEALAIVAIRGAGKSNTAAVMAEEMFAASIPFVVAEPEVPPADRPNGALKKAQQTILNVVASLSDLTIDPAPKTVVAIYAGCSPTSSTYSENLAYLRAAGLIEYGAEASVTITAKGREIAVSEGAVVSLDDFHGRLKKRFNEAQAKILDAVIAAYPNMIDRGLLATEVGASPTSSTYSENLSFLKRLRFLDYPIGGHVRATSRLFPEGLPE
jgi:hypothetical protein